MPTLVERLLYHINEGTQKDHGVVGQNKPISDKNWESKYIFFSKEPSGIGLVVNTPKQKAVMQEDLSVPVDGTSTNRRLVFVKIN